MLVANTAEGANLFVRKNGAALPAAAVSPVPIDPERSTWYKVTAGAYTRRYQADSLLFALRNSGVLTDSAGSVTTTPLALVVDSVPTQGGIVDAVRAAVEKYTARGLPVYALMQDDGGALIYAGAFARADQSAGLVRTLRGAGFEARTRLPNRESALVRLSKLEIHGFKSFADHTEMVFEPGVTAIVGPNGCGKSNVSDAVRWVLGEQRARTLRGAKMEEVIFQGSSARRAVNLAEVSLHFENDDGALDIPFREVVITRRLSRSGESDYFLNGAACRLRDIHDMVRGTGLGADSGVVIEARMVDALLSDRPDDRRELFEEAAGVGLYRDRKRSAERRLEETTTDLGRIDDLIAEVQSQVRSLSRQRKRAERYTELMARRFTLEVAHASREMDAWRGELARLEERVTLLRSEVPAEEERLRSAEASRDAALSERTSGEARRTELARLVSDQRESTQALRGEIAVAEERLRNAMSRRERAEEERREGDAIAGRVSGELERASTELAQLELPSRPPTRLWALTRGERKRCALVSAPRASISSRASARCASCAKSCTAPISTTRARSASVTSSP